MSPGVYDILRAADVPCSTTSTGVVGRDLEVAPPPFSAMLGLSLLGEVVDDLGILKLFERPINGIESTVSSF